MGGQTQTHVAPAVSRSLQSQLFYSYVVNGDEGTLCGCRKTSVAFASIDVNKQCFGAAVTHTKLPAGLQEQGITVILSSLTFATFCLPN